MAINIIGLDLSIGATGVVVLRYDGVGVKAKGKTDADEFKVVSSYVCGAPDPKGDDVDKGERLSLLARAVVASIGKFSGDRLYLFVEGYSFGSKHAARRIAEVHGAIFSALWGEYLVEPKYVTPASAKKAACPDYHGWSKDHWKKAGKKGEWKRSMPDKADVIAGVASRFKVAFATDAEADAFSVAVAGAEAAGVISLRNTVFVDARRFDPKR